MGLVLFVVATLAAFAAALTGCSSKVTPVQCTSMLDRYVEMTLDAEPALASLPPAQREVARSMKVAVKKAEPSYRKVQEQCEREVSRPEYVCAMDAKTPGDWEACID